MSASTLITSNFNNSSDANFRTWVAAFIAAIVAGGWVQTSDTGQINTATVTAPVAINTVAGYAVFRSNDTGGSLNEFYIKIEFGSGAVAASRPSVWITAGFQGTDGAGNLLSTVNPISTRTQIPTNATTAGASISINFASGSGYFCIAATSSTASEDLLFCVERTRDSSLAFQNQILMLGWSGQTNALNQAVDRSNAYPIVAAGNSCFAIPANANSPSAGVAGLGLIFGMAPGSTSPSINIFGVEASAIGAYQDTVTIAIISVNHSYKIQRDALFFAQATTVLLTRFE